MNKYKPGISYALMVLVFVACNLPGNVPSAPQNISVPTLGTVVLPPDTALPIPTLEPVVLSTDTASPTPTPQNPLVLRTTLCWLGPGQKYEVVSALKQNERVELLGVGSVSGWYIVKNPTYHDPCWVASDDLQIDAGTDLINLKTFTPPPLPTPTKPPTPLPSATPV